MTDINTHKEIKNIIFDIGNVLIDFCWEKDFRKKGLEGEVFERVADATARNTDWNEYDLGILSHDEIINKFVENDPEMEKEIRMVTKNLSGMLEKFSYTDKLIETLHSMGLGVYVISNFSFEAIHDAGEKLDFLDKTDGAILSCYYHIIKPGPQIYNLLLDKYSLIASECVFLDDKQENIDGAEAVGINGIRFKGIADALEELKGMGIDVKLT